MQNSQPRRILIVSYTFPPAPGVGGRRWAKSAKYFSRQGHHVEVLTAQNQSKTGSAWCDDVSGIKQHTFANTYPKILGAKPKTLVDKLAYRTALFKMKLRSSGTPYDRALCDKKSYLHALKRLLEKGGFDLVIATGPPFRLLSYTTQLIPKYPNICFVADFRDPWTWGETYGYLNLSRKRLNFEKQNEGKVVDKFDLIISPWSEIVEHLQKDYSDSENKITVLPHGYDPDDLPKAVNPSKPKSNLIHFVYGGTLYPDTLPHIEEMIDCVKQNSAKFKLDIYSHDRINAVSNGAGLSFHDPLKSQQFFEVLAKADKLVLLIPEKAKDGVPTKLYEYAALYKPILALGRQGKLSDFITEHKLGIFKAKGEDMNDFLNREVQIDLERMWLENHRLDLICNTFIKSLETLR